MEAYLYGDCKALESFVDGQIHLLVVDAAATDKRFG
jgi:hypothetical protein